MLRRLRPVLRPAGTRPAAGAAARRSSWRSTSGVDVRRVVRVDAAAALARGRGAGGGPASAGRRPASVVARPASAASGRRPTSTPASRTSRSGILLIGVAVTTSRPKTSSRTSSGTATQRGDRALQQRRRRRRRAGRRRSRAHRSSTGSGRCAAAPPWRPAWRRPADQAAAAVLRVAPGVAHQPARADQQQHRQRDRDRAEEEPDGVGQPRADRPGAGEPDRHRAEDGQAEQQQAGAVAAVLRVQLPGGGGLPADGPDPPADAVRQAHPQRADGAADVRRRGGPGRGPSPRRRPGGLLRRLTGTTVRGTARRRAASPARLRGTARHRVTVTALPGRSPLFRVVSARRSADHAADVLFASEGMPDGVACFRGPSGRLWRVTRRPCVR